jgi:hypothetical protein
MIPSPSTEAWGAGGPGFESRHPDQSSPTRVQFRTSRRFLCASREPVPPHAHLINRSRLTFGSDYERRRCGDVHVDGEPGSCRLAGPTTRADRHRETVAVIRRPTCIPGDWLPRAAMSIPGRQSVRRGSSRLCGRPVFRGIEGYAVVLELNNDCRIGKNQSTP